MDERMNESMNVFLVLNVKETSSHPTCHHGEERFPGVLNLQLIYINLKL